MILEQKLKIIEKLNKQPEKNIIEFLENEKNNSYVEVLIKEILSEEFDIKKAVEYGLSQISEDKEQKLLLSSYFFLLSELKDLDNDVRDFILDVSVWCEEAEDYSQYFKTFDPFSVYEEKIKPLLK